MLEFAVDKKSLKMAFGQKQFFLAIKWHMHKLLPKQALYNGMVVGDLVYMKLFIQFLYKVCSI